MGWSLWASGRDEPVGHLNSSVSRRLLGLALGVMTILAAPTAAQADGPIGAWVSGPPMAEHPDYHLALVLKDGRVLIVSSSGAEVYDPVANRWSQAGTPAINRGNQAATLLRDGRVLVTGGIDGPTGRSVPTTELYDPATNTWSAAASMAGRRYDHTATLLGDGRVLIAGGTRSTVILDSTEIYDPTSNTWSPGPSLPSPRTGHAATLLPDGRLLVVGGNGTSDPLATADLYDPLVNRWSSTNPMSTARSTLSSILLKDGRVLAIGGVPVVSGPPIAELFNPQLETWSPAGSSTEPTFYYGAATTILKDGRVFICGGANQTLNGDGLVVGYVYDPTADRWVTTTPMVQGRVSHTASLLPDGRVLVAGGRNAQVNGSGLDTTEIFDVNATVTASPATTAAIPIVGGSASATPIQSLASRLLAAPLLVGGVAVLAIGILGTVLVRRQRARRRRRSF
jgi:N-acetylneuraminic acid mutarotase